MGQSNSTGYHPGAEEPPGRRGGSVSVSVPPLRHSSPSLSDQMLLASLHTRQKQLPRGASSSGINNISRPSHAAPPRSNFAYYSRNRDCNSLPASSAASPCGSRTPSLSSVSSVSACSPSPDSSPSPSRQQSITFVDPSRQGPSFIAWSPQQAAERRLQRTASAPRLPHSSEIEQYLLPEDSTVYSPARRPRAAHDATAAPAAAATATPAAGAAQAARATGAAASVVIAPPFAVDSVVFNSVAQSSQPREPCLVGWCEVESPKEMNIISTGSLLFRCTYCNGVLRRTKNYISTWPKVLFCEACRSLPQCNSCCKKAVPFLYIGAEGKPLCSPPLLNFGGLSACGQCRLINPIADESSLQQQLLKARQLLRSLFELQFTNRLVAPHRQPAVRSCLEALSRAFNQQDACTVQLSYIPTEEELTRTSQYIKEGSSSNSSSNSNKKEEKERLCMRSNSAEEVQQLPFDVMPVWHMQLARAAGVSNIYGRCETRALTFPAVSFEEEKERKEKIKETDTIQKTTSMTTPTTPITTESRTATTATAATTAAVTTKTKHTIQPSRTYHVVQRILLSRGLPEALLEGHLVHELLHAFIWLDSDGCESMKIDLAAEEGLCNCILACALQVKVETLQKKRENIMRQLLKRGIKPKTNPGNKEIDGLKETRAFLQAVRSLRLERSEQEEQEEEKEEKDEIKDAETASQKEASARTPQILSENEQEANEAFSVSNKDLHLNEESEEGVHTPQLKTTAGNAYSTLFEQQQEIEEENGGKRDEEEAEERSLSVFRTEYDLYVTEYELKVVNRRLAEMERDKDPAYGEGYRTTRKLAMQTKMKKLVSILNAFGHTINAFVHAAQTCA